MTIEDIADNILTHLECTGTPRKAHGERGADVALIADILRASLHAQGYVRIETLFGQPLTTAEKG